MNVTIYAKPTFRLRLSGPLDPNDELPLLEATHKICEGPAPYQAAFARQLSDQIRRALGAADAIFKTNEFEWKV